jgi:heme/copper-type cytochrome/quinol oxidase subunit 1
MALAQSWLWFIGMLMFSIALHQLGLMGAPRRTMISQATYFQPEWKAVLPWVGIGGTLLFISGMLYLVNLALERLHDHGRTRRHVRARNHGAGGGIRPADTERCRAVNGN